ncbi:MAG: hypothetical protein IPK72_04245 [Candidatus Eisenbacteria bacterium]|nr:hypothetical protein [Candidatus Eisenbacteria bacterium]
MSLCPGLLSTPRCAESGAIFGWLLTIACLLGSACGSHPSKPRPTAGGWSLEWITPPPGESIGGEVTLEVRAPERAVFDRVEFRLDGVLLGTADQAPYRLLWPGPESGPDLRRIFAAQAFLDSTPVSEPVFTERIVVSDAAPLLAVRLPGRALWIEQGRGASLLAEAWDPEDGALDADAVAWTTEFLPEQRGGLRLALDALPPGLQRIRVEARDLRSRPTRVDFAAAPFTYRGSESPADCLWNLMAALQALDPVAVGAQFAPGFAFVPCGGGPGDADGEEPAIWTAESFLSRLTDWMGDPSLSLLTIDWRMGTPAVGVRGGRTRAFCEVRELGRRFVRDGDSRIGPGAHAGTVVSSREGRITFDLVRGTDQLWRIEVWREEAPRVGPALGELLRARDGAGRAPAG